MGLQQLLKYIFRLQRNLDYYFMLFLRETEAHSELEPDFCDYDSEKFLDILN